MSPRVRRIVYVILYEIIAIAMTSAAMIALGHESETSGLTAVLSSAIALAWNWVFTSAFERWESRQTVRGRSLLRRVVHAIGFEGGLTFFLVPLFAWLLQVSLWEALMMDISLLVLFLVYTFVFNLAFDKMFGLPASAA